MTWFFLLLIAGVLVVAVAGWKQGKSRQAAPPLHSSPAPEKMPSFLDSAMSTPRPPQLRSAPAAVPAQPVQSRARRSPQCEGDRFWIPAGESVTVSGRNIGGMVYTGSGLKPMHLYRGDVEPALIDPRQRVSWSQPDHEGRLMSYWPYYTWIPPASRAAYLHWLSGGRKDPAAYIGYVFLFFYGIERRVLVDAQQSDEARSEVDGLLKEVERLLGVYGGNRSFQGYAGAFLSVSRLLYRGVDPSALQPPRRRESFMIPLSLKIGLGAFVAEDKPIPPEWAFGWVISHPEIRLRTAAQRCPEEFEALFKIRYAEAFPEGGLRIKPGKKLITAEYRPASPSFLGSVSLKVPNLPDVTDRTGPLRKLLEIVEPAQQDLDVYSRWVGRTGDGGSPAAVALLPPELARGRESEEVRRLVAWVEGRLAGEESAVVPASELVERWPGGAAGKLAKRDAEMLAAFLERRGYGIEPDVRFGGPASAGTAVLFRQESGTAEPGPAYHGAAVLLHLAVAVSAADGAVSPNEERHLAEHLESILHLSPAERTRLNAHLRWLIASPPGLAGLKKRIAPLPEAQRRGIGQFLVTVAGADGHVGSEELKLLSRVYTLLGLDAQAVYSDVHALASSEAPPAAEPVTVRPAGPAPAGRKIPPPRPEGVTLDPRKIQQKLTESEDVAGLLEGIFAEEEEAARPEVARKPELAGPPPVAGLDAAHSELLRRLAEKPVWERVEVERLAGPLGLLPDGALEVINEAAFERCGAPLLEGDETLEIDGQILEEMLA